jgi:hypothetical protein
MLAWSQGAFTVHETGMALCHHVGVSAARTLELAREPTAPALARRFVCDRLTDSGLGELCDSAELAITEVVTNVLVHTDSTARVRVLSDSDSARVEVEDGCPALPVPGMLDPTAVSGRGLMLVTRLTRRWGVTPAAKGKVVWFEVGSAAAGDVDGLLDSWSDDLDLRSDDVESDAAPDVAPQAAPDAAPGASRDPLRRVRLEKVPTRLLNDAKSHLDGLVRDMALLNEAASAHATIEDDLADLAARLKHLATELIWFRNEIRRQAVEAVERGDALLNLQLDLPLSLRGRLIEYRDTLDEADQQCAQGRLLVEVPPPEQVEFRRWKLDRIIEQLSGDEPHAHPWPSGSHFTA